MNKSKRNMMGVLIVGLVCVGTSDAFGAFVRRVTFRPQTKDYEVLGYAYGNRTTGATFAVPAAGFPFKVPAGGPAVVRLFKPPFNPNTVVVLHQWNDPPGQAAPGFDHAHIAAKGGAFGIDLHCNKSTETGVTCCQVKGEATTCCADPDYDCAEVCNTPISSGTLEVFKDAVFDAEEGGESVPTVSEWGLIFMGLLVFSAGSLLYGRWRRVGTTA